MAFLVVVSALTGAAAWMADAGLRRLGMASRWAWLVALAAGPVLLVAAWLGVPAAGSGVGGPLGAVPVVELPGLVVGEDVGGWGLPWLGGLLAAVWGLSVLALAAALFRAHRTLARERRGWQPVTVLGREVLVSPDRGPAVAGLRSGWMVLPGWAADLPEAELRLVLVHEEEHLRAGDPLALAMGLGLLLVAPWNPVAWWQLRRLRTAMEVDCDARVLARHPDRRTYGASLLSVASRASGPSLALAAFSERSTSLEERILTMTRSNSRTTKALGALLVLLAALVGVQACGVDSPMASAPEVDPPEASAAGDAPAPDAPVVRVPEEVDVPQPQGRDPVSREPTFTPFTIAPSIQNRREVVEAMEGEYPPLLHEAGIGGTVRVYFYIDESGRVGHTRIDQSSGHQALDQAALRVASVYRFNPALNGDRKVPVWVSFPITFQTR